MATTTSGWRGKPLAVACWVALFPHVSLPADKVDLSVEETHVLVALNEARKTQGLTRVVPDSALMSVCRAHARDMAKEEYVGPISTRLGPLRYQLARAGVTAMATAHVLARVDSLDDLPDKFGAPPYRVSQREGTHVGAGVAKGKKADERYVAVVIVREHVALQPFPIENVTPGVYHLKGGASGASRPVAVYVETPSHLVRRVQAQSRTNGAFDAAVALEAGPGPYVLSLVVEGEPGSFVSDRITSYVGMPYPPPIPKKALAQRSRAASQTSTKGPRLSGRSFELINQVNAARKTAGMPHLQIESDLTHIAIENTKAMVKLGQPNGALADARIRGARLAFKRYRIVLFVQSELPTPAELKIVMAPQHTHIGVAIMEAETARYGPGSLWATVIVMQK